MNLAFSSYQIIYLYMKLFMVTCPCKSSYMKIFEIYIFSKNIIYIVVVSSVILFLFPGKLLWIIYMHLKIFFL